MASMCSGITLSEEQKLIADARAINEGLQDKVKFKLIDYRADFGTFDRIVSVGMFEHVGTPNYMDYFEAIEKKLNKNGIALIHTIGRMSPPGNTSPWLEKYIFPADILRRCQKWLQMSNKIIFTSQILKFGAYTMPKHYITGMSGSLKMKKK